MELVDYLRVLRRRWWLVALTVVLCTAAALGFSLRQVKLYETTARFNVSGSSSVSAIDEITTRQLAVQRASTYAQFATTGPAVEAATKAAGYTGGTGVTANADGTTPFLTVTVRDTDPIKASRIANAYLTALPATVSRLDNGPSAAKQELSILEAAGVPVTPVSPNPLRDGSVGLALGLILGLGTAFLREALDRSYNDPDQIEEATGVSVLGVVPQELNGVDLPTVTHMTSARAEAYRTIRTNIQFAGVDESLRTIVITSATPGEGKTTVAVNLAVAFARTGQRVVIVDADMRRPRVTAAFGLRDKLVAGLADILNGRAGVDEALVWVDEGQLAVLPAGPSPENPSELLGSNRMAALLAELAATFDVVLVDSPPVLPVTDPLVLAGHATGVLLVVKLGGPARERIKRALGSLTKLDVPLLGIVANGSSAMGDAAYGYGAKYSQPSSSGKLPRGTVAPVTALRPAQQRTRTRDQGPERGPGGERVRDRDVNTP